MSRFRVFSTATALQWKAQVERFSSVEILLVCGWLLLIVVRRGCDAIAETCFFWAVSARQEAEHNDEDVVGVGSSRSHKDIASEAEESLEESWRQYFSNPEQWWDNRRGKINPRAPDFKHKRTRKALWIDGYCTSEWVRVRFDEKLK